MDTADTVLMVPPKHFSFNTETAKSNAFQNRLALDANTINTQAKTEFKGVVQALEANGIVVLLLDPSAAYTPDAVFPNNWFSTHIVNNEKYLFIYPMLSDNRKQEVQLSTLQHLLKTKLQANYQIVDLRTEDAGILEGTGVLIFDHKKKMAFMSSSERADTGLAKKVVTKLGYELVTFISYDKQAQPIYHTNVMMSIGEQFAFICLEAIKPLENRAQVKAKLTQMGKIIIELSLAQIYGMAGNVLELQNKQQQHFLLLSSTADQHLTASQKTIIDQFCTRLPCNISTIETIGGGSIRCMLAEIFY
jgi:hypothetical protein